MANKVHLWMGIADIVQCHRYNYISASSGIWNVTCRDCLKRSGAKVRYRSGEKPIKGSRKWLSGHLIGVEMDMEGGGFLSAIITAKPWPDVHVIRPLKQIKFQDGKSWRLYEGDSQ